MADLSGHQLPALDARRLLPARRRVRVPRSAAGRHGAVALASRAGARAPARARLAASSSKATFSTGGTNRRGRGLRSSVFRTICCGCRYVAAEHVRATGDAAVLDEAVAVPRGARAGARRARVVRQPTVAAGARARCSSTASARSTKGIDRRRARPAAVRHGRLERRHEPRRRTADAARARGSASSLHSVLTAFVPLCEARGDARARRRLSRLPRRASGRSSNWRGTANGTGAATTTTARRSGRRRTTSAASTRSRSRGRCCRAPCRSASPNARWTRSRPR